MPNFTQIKGVIDDTKGIQYEKQPYLGSPQARIKVVEVADYKCPACRIWNDKMMGEFKKDYIDTGKVQLYFMNFPFLDRDSILAASAGEAIFHQSNDRFWEFSEKLYQQQGDEQTIWATRRFLLDFVKSNIDGIDYPQFERDFKDNVYMLDVKEDFKIAGNLGVNGTPQFFVNGVHLPSKTTYEQLVAVIDKELSK